MSISSSIYTFTFTGKERDEETGYTYHGARYFDAALLTSWMAVDPMSDKYPSLSPYNYCAWNPVKLVDEDGEESSTHTDFDGNVVAVYDDGDNGVYRHNGDENAAKAEVERNYSSTNTSAGGTKMGESLHSLSFADQTKYNDHGEITPMPHMKIDFGSNQLTDEANKIMAERPSLFQYAKNAGTHGRWDIKHHEHMAHYYLANMLLHAMLGILWQEWLLHQRG